MKKIQCFVKSSIFALALATSTAVWANQTATVSPIYPQHELPFRVKIKLMDLQLPNGIQDGASAHYKGKWLFIAGRTNGLHGFDVSPDNFPIRDQNRKVYVVDLARKKVKVRSLTDHASGLTQKQIDSLSVTVPQFYQRNKTLYMTGGYGIDTASGTFTTKKTLTAIDVPGLMSWVEKKTDKHARHFIRQISHPIFQITGGYMNCFGKQPTLLVFGQKFTGTYFLPPNTQLYSEQIRRFRIRDDGKKLKVKILRSLPSKKNPNYRRRDLNVIPVIKERGGKLYGGLLALSGVFTPEPDSGAWTVPVEISANGKPFMPDPFLESTFKQGMNNYMSATAELFSKETSDMYTILLGGITYEYYQNGELLSDSELPFTNQVTTIRIDKQGRYKQFFMKAEYPYIRSTGANPGNQLLFGANARFMLADDVEYYSNKVIKLDKIKKRKVIGYIVGGIQSTLPNTNTITDSSASPLIFKVILERK